jgi:acetoacetyl-CoA synthetase
VVTEGELLWTPSEERVRAAEITRYSTWLAEHRGVDLPTYAELWRWSVDDLEAFWASLWDFFDVRAAAAYDRVLGRREMPGTEWFPGARLNYAEHLLRHDGDAVALHFVREDGLTRVVTFADLRAQVASVQAALRRLGVRSGDRVAALVPNSPEAVVAMLATTSLGAIWSSCSPDFGARGVADRFTQIEPVVLFAVDGYVYGGRSFDVRETVARLREQLPSLRATVSIGYLDPQAVLPDAGRWDDLLTEPGDLAFEPVPFDHPLWILYSSGTTGLPKPIVHGHGGILLEHLKQLALHLDVKAGDRLFWFTTTGWMMWNLLISGLALGSGLVLYDGNPAHPDMSALWRLAESTGITCFGTSAPYIQACMKAGLHPRADGHLSSLRVVGSTGAPLPPEGFEWVYAEVGRDLLLASVSGGTDVCTAFVGASPTLPVHAGELPCRALGAKVEAYDDRGRPVVGEVGELVITEPLPSMPVMFWNDPDGSRLRASYFEDFPGVWRHGDWIKITERGSCVIYGRSDSTLNRGGVRMGTSEFYRVVEDLPEIVDSLVIDTSDASGEGELLLFVVLAEGVSLADVEPTLRERIRRDLSPRHVPNRVIAVDEVPRTLNGKKCEVPVKRILAGVPVEQAVSAGALRNAGALGPFLDLRRDAAAR